MHVAVKNQSYNLIKYFLSQGASVKYINDTNIHSEIIFVIDPMINKQSK